MVLTTSVLLTRESLHAADRYSAQARKQIDNVSKGKLYHTQTSSLLDMGVLKSVERNSYNANPVIEDTAVVLPLAEAVPEPDMRHPNTNFANELLVGVYDGHSGTGTSYFAEKELFDFLLFLYEQDSFAWAGSESNAATRTHLTRPLERAMSGEWGSLAYEAGASQKHLTRFSVPYYLEQAFLLADYAHLNLALAEDVKRGQSGACAIVVHADGDSGVLTVANAGDCMAVVGRRRPESKRAATAEHRPDSSGGVRFLSGNNPTAGQTRDFVNLNLEHQIDVEPAERRRLLDQHKGESDIVRRNRIKGRLQPTRGLGDGSYKAKPYYEHRPDRFKERYPANTWLPPYSSSQPDVTQYQLREGDEFLVVSTDGLFQDLTSQQVVDYVGEYQDLVKNKVTPGSGSSKSSSWLGGLFGGGNSDDAPNCASFLISKSLLHASEDAYGKQGSEAQSLSHIYYLQDKGKARRNIHDDNTVVVIWFDQDKLKRLPSSSSSSSLSLSSSSSSSSSSKAPRPQGISLPAALGGDAPVPKGLHIPDTLRRFSAK
jgi:serine/threonine protein phosphatase PrpC